MDARERCRWRVRGGCLALGALPVLAFPQPDLGWVAWVVLVPALLVLRAAPGARQAAARGWWFGGGYLTAALYWTIPNIGPGLLLVALVFGALWTGWGVAAWWLLPRHPVASLVVLPAVWVVIELVRSWPRLGGPWALLGATQSRYPAVLDLAAVGGVWLVSFALVAVNVAVALVVLTRRPVLLVVAAMVVAAGPLLHTVRAGPPVDGTWRVALVQPGVVHDPASRFEASVRITRGLPPVDLVVWGESSVGYDLARRGDLAARLRALATDRAVLVNEDARDARGRISKSAVLFRPDGTTARYVKTRLVPFGEYIPFRPVLGWLAGISRAAGQDRVPGTGVEVMRADGATVGPLTCFESAFPDLGRAAARDGAQILAYQSSTSTFQGSWAPEQHAALVAVRAAESGRPAVQAALTGVSTAADARGRRLVWLGTGSRGATVATLDMPPSAYRTPYVRFGDCLAFLSLAIAAVAALVGAHSAVRNRDRGGTPRGQVLGKQHLRGGATGADDAE